MKKDKFYTTEELRLQELSKRSKFNIYIDEDSHGIGTELKKLGYSIKEYSKGTSDEAINLIINKASKNIKEKPVILVTKNYTDFLDFSIRNYFVLGISDIIATDDKNARRIQHVLISNNNGFGFLSNGFLKLGKSWISKGLKYGDYSMPNNFYNNFHEKYSKPVKCTDGHQLIKVINDKAKRIISLREQGQPEVGIFWHLSDNVVFYDAVPMREGEQYGDFINYGDHFKHWQSLRRHGMVKHEIGIDIEDYSSIPRGRVVYNTQTEQYTVYHGKDFPDVLKQDVMSEFKLPLLKTGDEVDEHYIISE